MVYCSSVKCNSCRACRHRWIMQRGDSLRDCRKLHCRKRRLCSSPQSSFLRARHEQAPVVENRIHWQQHPGLSGASSRHDRAWQQGKPMGFARGSGDRVQVTSVNFTQLSIEDLPLLVALTTPPGRSDPSQNMPQSKSSVSDTNARGGHLNSDTMF